MFQQMVKLAPLGQWVRIGVAALLITLGIVGIAHLYIAIRGYRDYDLRPLSPGSLATVLRWTLFMFASGFAICGFDLHWSATCMAALVITAVVMAVLESIARIRGGAPPRI